MTRAYGYWKKMLHDIQTLRSQKALDAGKTLADVMRHYANTGEYPSDPALRGQLKWHQLASRAILNMVPKTPGECKGKCLESCKGCDGKGPGNYAKLH